MKQIKHFYSSRSVFFIYFTIVAVFIVNSGYCQENNEYFIYKHITNIEDTNKLYFDFQNTNFIKNNEYFGDYIEGYTNLGFNLLPSFIYSPNEKMNIRLGGFFLKYSGRDEFTEIEPILSVNYEPFKDIQIILGTIQGNLAHNLPEPIFDFERYLSNPIENGLQILINKDRLKTDLWIDWDQFILHEDPFQEMFSAGISSNAIVLNKEKKYSVSIPIQLFFRHNGGQITTAKDPLLTIMNSNLGLEFKYFMPEKFFHTLKFSGNYLSYEDLSPKKKQAFKDGFGIYPTIELLNKNIDLMAGYWYGEQFIAPYGNYLFQSISNNKVYIETNHRELLTAKLSYHKTLDRGITFAFRGETYFDIKENIFDYAIGIYIAINQRFFIKEFDK